jgi:hypothetical protein
MHTEKMNCAGELGEFFRAEVAWLVVARAAGFSISPVWAIDNFLVVHKMYSINPKVRLKARRNLLFYENVFLKRLQRHGTSGHTAIPGATGRVHTD